MTFDEKRVGCGMSHPLIKVGAKGFFKGDFLHSHLLTLYLLLAGVDRGSYLDEVRCQ